MPHGHGHGGHHKGGHGHAGHEGHGQTHEHKPIGKTFIKELVVIGLGLYIAFKVFYPIGYNVTVHLEHIIGIPTPPPYTTPTPAYTVGPNE